MRPDGDGGILHEDVGYGFVDPLVRGFPPVLDDAETLRVKADSFKTKAAAIHTRAKSVHTIWQRLGQHYHAPEQEIVLSAMTKPEATAWGIAEDVGTAVKALHSFADALDGLARRRRELLMRGVDINIDHQAFQDNFPHYPCPSPGEILTGEYDGADSQHDKLTSRSDTWNNDIAQFVEDNFDAQQECINSISAIYGRQPLRGEEHATAADRAADRVYGGDAATYVDAARFGVADRSTPNLASGSPTQIDVSITARGADAIDLRTSLAGAESKEIEDPEPPPADEARLDAAWMIDAALPGLASRRSGPAPKMKGRARSGGGGPGLDLPDMTLLYRIDGTVLTGPKSDGTANSLARAQGVVGRFSDGKGPASAASILVPSTWVYMTGLKKSPSRSTWEYVTQQQRRRTVTQEHAPKPPTAEDVEKAYKEAKRINGVPVDHRTDYPLDGDARKGRGWHMKWDPDGNKGEGEWVPENPGRGLPNNNYPAQGIPNSTGYDGNGNRLPYANYRPEIKESTVNKVYSNAKDRGHGHVLVETLNKDEYGRFIRREVVWQPGMDRAWRGGPITPNMWDMGHHRKAKYSNLLSQYLDHKISREVFLSEYNEADNYLIEDPARNRSHVDE